MTSPADARASLEGSDDLSSTDRAAWPFEVAPELLAAWRAARPEADPAHALDHQLACACLAGIPGAAEVFVEHHLVAVDAWLPGLGSDRVDDIRQALAERLLFAGDDGAAPKLAAYQGRGPLGGWVRVAALRESLMLDRRQRKQSRAGERDEMVDPHDPELAFLRDRYRPHFAEAMRAARAAIEPGQRLLLRLHFIEGVTTAALAALHHTSRATIVRRLGDAKQALRDAVTRELTARLGLGASEQMELLRALWSVLELRLSSP